MITVASWFLILVVIALCVVAGVAALVVMASRGSGGGGRNLMAAQRDTGLPNRDERVINLRQRGERYKEERERILGMVETSTISSDEADQLLHSLERETTAAACPFCAGDIRAEAVKCKHCKHWLVDEYRQEKRLTKSKNNRMIAGVCGGIAEYFEADPTLVRMVAVALLVLSAFVTGLIIYLVAAMIMPEADP